MNFPGNTPEPLTFQQVSSSTTGARLRSSTSQRSLEDFLSEGMGTRMVHDDIHIIECIQGYVCVFLLKPETSGFFLKLY